MQRSFRTQKDFRDWLERNHASVKELVIRLFKVHAASKGIGYRDALDEALCFGWIDGVRHGLDEDRFTVRFTPRKAKSNWSKVNISRVAELKSEGRMHAAGLAAFEARHAIAVAPYSFENRNVTLDAASEKTFRANKVAWAFFQTQPPWYRRTCMFWVMSAKREETRARRLASLIDRAAKGTSVPPLARAK